MIAAWYDRQGPPAEVLEVGELPASEPGPGEVRVRLAVSGPNPGDMKKRHGWLGSAMAFPRIIPHSDGAGVIEVVGPGVDPGQARRAGVGVRRSVLPAIRDRGAEHGRAQRAGRRPAGRGERRAGACLGIPGITAHRAVFADGPVGGQTMLVHGVLGSVSSLAAQLARWAGATVIGTVRTDVETGSVHDGAADHVVSLESDPAAAIRRLAPDGVDRVIEVALSANADLDAAVVRNGAVVAAYASPRGPARAAVLADALRERDYPAAGQRRLPAGRQGRRRARPHQRGGGLGAVGPRRRDLPLARIAAAHELIESGAAAGRVLVAIP